MIKEQNSVRLKENLSGCLKGDRKAQKDLYALFHAYAFSVCMRYSRNRDDAIEIMNDGFMKIFTQLSRYDQTLNFRFWLRRIMINTAIDAYRKTRDRAMEVEYTEVEILFEQEDILAKLSAEDLLDMVQRLPPSYRMVFTLFAVDGFSHQEIADMLKIDLGTSKSNLFKARRQLKYMLTQLELNDKRRRSF